MACLLPYVLNPLERDDIEALAINLATLSDRPTSAPSRLLAETAKRFSKYIKTALLLVKPAATQSWLATAWGLTAQGPTPVTLATATSYPPDIESNTNGFAGFGSVRLSPVCPGLLCAVLAESGDAVDPIRVLPIGFVK